jgi:Flp pilus assembly protein TadG
VQLLRRSAAARQGASTVEFAFIMALFLIPLVLGVIDLGLGLFMQMEVGNSARAGAEFATYCKCADDSQIAPVVVTTIKTAEQTATNLGLAVFAHTAQFCGCASAGSLSFTFTNPDGSTQTAVVEGLSLAPGGNSGPFLDPALNTTNLPSCDVAGTQLCTADNSVPGTYVTVSASYPYTPFLPYPGIVPASGTIYLSATATARIY